MKTLLALLLLIPSLSLSWESEDHRKFKDQIEDKLRSEGLYERKLDIEKKIHQDQLDKLKNEELRCINRFKRNEELLISQNIDPRELMPDKPICENYEWSKSLYESREKLRVEKITKGYLHSEIIELNNQKLKSKNPIEIKDLDTKIEELLKQYTIYVYGKETKMKDCFISGDPCSSITMSNKSIFKNDKKTTYSSKYLNDNNNSYEFIENSKPKIDYFQPNAFNNLSDKSNSYLGKPVHTDGTNFYDSYGNIVNQDSYGNSYDVGDVVCTLSFCK